MGEDVWLCAGLVKLLFNFWRCSVPVLAFVGAGFIAMQAPTFFNRVQGVPSMAVVSVAKDALWAKADSVQQALLDSRAPSLDPQIPAKQGASQADSLLESARKQLEHFGPRAHWNRAMATSPLSQCTFKDERGKKAFCSIEKPEHKLVRKFIPPNATVLELGARYGTTSCEISHQLQNSGRVLAVEPDDKVWQALEENRERNSCNFLILKGAIASTPVYREGNSYGTRVRSVVHHRGLNDTKMLKKYPVLSIPSLTFEDVEREFGLQFDTLLIDCEGCVNEFLATNRQILRKIRLILIELDQGHYKEHRTHIDIIDYNKVIGSFEKEGFHIVGRDFEAHLGINHFAMMRQ